MRVIVVATLVLAVHPLWEYSRYPVELEPVFAFFVGFFPEAGLRLMKKGLMAPVRLIWASDDTERYPLRQLDGMNIWYESRLVEEGVENMQNLSTTNIVDLMLNTRMPIARFMDWIDQSFLYLRVEGSKNGGRDDRMRLRRLGIRNATDFVRVFDSSKDNEDFHASFCRMLNLTDCVDDQGTSAVEGIRYSLEGEVNLVHVRHYKSHDWLTRPAEG